jgi:predicted glycoside hydrolase/deacetylase ChbG (UPF0249 family)
MKTKLTVLLLIFNFLICASARQTISLKKDRLHLNERFVILTADDFGASANINAGIKIAADKNAITSISALPNFIGALAELKEIAEKHPEISIGVHLNISTGKPVLGVDQLPSLVNADGNFYTLETLLPVISHISTDELRNELEAQILAAVKSGIKPDFISDHCGVLSLYSPFFEILTSLAKEYEIPIRSPLVASRKYPDLFPNSAMNRQGVQLIQRLAVTDPSSALGLFKCTRLKEMERKVQQLDQQGILHPDVLIDSFWGDPTASNLLYILDNLPDGTSEIVFHLGTFERQYSYPSGLDVNSFGNREEELITITSDYLKDYFTLLKIRPIGYQEFVASIKQE